MRASPERIDQRTRSPSDEWRIPANRRRSLRFTLSARHARTTSSPTRFLRSAVPGVQRVLKLVKYLPRHGVTPSVLTARGALGSRPRSFARARGALEHRGRARAGRSSPATRRRSSPGRPAAQSHELAPRRCIGAAVGLARRLLVPDPQVLWLPAASVGSRATARVAARRRRRLHQRAAVLASSCSRLSRACGPAPASCSTIATNGRPRARCSRCPARRRRRRTLERRFLRRAHVVTTATEEFRSALLERFPFLDESRVVAIPNGYDPEDFPPSSPAADAIASS